MDRTQKAEFLEDFTPRIQAAPFVALLDYRGVTANEVNELRRKLEERDYKLEVVKNTLTKRAIAGTEKEGLGAHLEGMTAVIVSGEDPIACAKAVKDCIDPKGKVQVKAGYFEDVLDPEGVKAVASLPGREELLVMLLQTLLAAPRQVMGIIKAPARDLLYLLKNYEAKLAEQEDGE